MGNKTGMYMPASQDHKAWVAKRKERKQARKDQASCSASAKCKATNANDSSKRGKGGSGGTIALSKSFDTALATKVQISDPEIKAIIEGAAAKAHKYSDDSPNNPSKE